MKAAAIGLTTEDMKFLEDGLAQINIKWENLPFHRLWELMQMHYTKLQAEDIIISHLLPTNRHW